MPVARDLGSRLGAWLAPLAAPERRVEVAGGVTLMVLLLTANETWPLRLGIVVLVAAAVADRRLVRAGGFWAVVSVLYVAGEAGAALVIDNHEWLLGYWVLALAVTRLVADPVAGLATSARLLIGLAFGFATLWKAVTPEYVAGDAFHAFLLFDPRFGGVAPLLTDLTSEQWAENYRALTSAVTVADARITLPVVDAPGVRAVAVGMTWWTLAIEGSVAAAFLAPTRSRLGQARHALLLVFLATTYVVAPVHGFGWLLVAMGLADAPLERKRWLLPAFAIAFLLITVRSMVPIEDVAALLGAG